MMWPNNQDTKLTSKMEVFSESEAKVYARIKKEAVPLVLTQNYSIVRAATSLGISAKRCAIGSPPRFSAMKVRLVTP